MLSDSGNCCWGAFFCIKSSTFCKHRKDKCVLKSVQFAKIHKIRPKSISKKDQIVKNKTKESIKYVKNI